MGPLGLGELARLVAERGATRAKRPEVSVRQAAQREPRVAQLLDGRLASVPALLDGAVLTHRLDQEEADGEMLPVDPDLAPLAPLAGWVCRWWRAGVWSGAAKGTCTDRPAGSAASGLGSWLGCGYVRAAWRSAPQRCRSKWGPRRPPAAGGSGARAVRAGRDGWGGLAPALPLALVVLQAMAEAPGLLRQVTLPLGELLAGAGFETRWWLVGRAGTDWLVVADAASGPLQAPPTWLLRAWPSSVATP